MQIYQMIEKHFKPVPLDRPVVFQQQRGNRIEASTIKTRQKKTIQGREIEFNANKEIDRKTRRNIVKKKKKQQTNTTKASKVVKIVTEEENRKLKNVDVFILKTFRIYELLVILTIKKQNQKKKGTESNSLFFHLMIFFLLFALLPLCHVVHVNVRRNA